MGTQQRHPLVDAAYQARRNGDREGALTLYVAASQALRSDQADRTALASAIRHAGDLYEELADAPAAWAAYDEAWGLYTALAPALALDRANCRRPMALWQEQHGDTAVALGMWREARGMYEQGAVATGLDLQAAYDECDRHIAALGAM